MGDEALAGAHLALEGDCHPSDPQLAERTGLDRLEVVVEDVELDVPDR